MAEVNRSLSVDNEIGYVLIKNAFMCWFQTKKVDQMMRVVLFQRSRWNVPTLSHKLWEADIGDADCGKDSASASCWSQESSWLCK